MNDLRVMAALAGIFFGLWPLFMNRSGLTGNVSSAAFCVAAFIGVLPFAIKSGVASLATANWLMVAFAGLFGALGLLSFNGMLAGSSIQNVGNMFVLMTVVQIVVASVYQAMMNGHVSIDKIGGYVAAAMAAYLLLR
ncbi:MAG: hypothetical protein UV01_C0001G0040 [Parcubacteria group bacterium GW2011_GWA2_42_14]|nr:MAG: hypothetical protein UV01_C0001G0040 [Parcubacteria group bacterium GW2011_GWA2_42_14]